MVWRQKEKTFRWESQKKNWKEFDVALLLAYALDWESQKENWKGTMNIIGLVVGIEESQKENWKLNIVVCQY